MKFPAPITAADFDNLLVDQRPMIDLRAPIEFRKGAFPSSISLPLMTDRERELVGTCYKQQGQDEAIKLGHELVRGKTKQQRVQAWAAQVAADPDTILYCFRGGLRSRISQQWLAEAGYPIAFVEGGYKAIRQHCIQRTEQLVAELPAIVLSGRTGTGKTRVLGDFPRYIDLEGLAHHRGSSFGKQLDPQPTQINFESALAAELIRLSRISSKAIAFEDESRLIGRCMMPECLQAKLKHSPILVLEDDMAARVERILDEYVIEATALRKQRFDNKQQAFDDLSASLTKSLHKIRKRLGGEAHQEALGLLTNALRHQSLTDNFEAHKDWILFLLQRYYDPMYDYQLSLKSQRVVIRGNATELKQWLQHHHPA